MLRPGRLEKQARRNSNKDRNKKSGRDEPTQILGGVIVYTNPMAPYARSDISQRQNGRVGAKVTHGHHRRARKSGWVDERLVLMGDGLWAMGHGNDDWWRGSTPEEGDSSGEVEVPPYESITRLLDSQQISTGTM